MIALSNSGGSGETLVLLHGWGMNSKVWAPLLERLTPYFEIICVDLPGHGESDYANSWNLDDLVEELAGKLPEKFHLLGWSLGGMVALKFNELYPERVDKLIMLAASAKFTQAENWQNAQPVSILDAFINSLQKSPEMTVKRFLLLQTRGMENPKVINKWMKTFIAESSLPCPKSLESGLNILATADLRPSLAKSTNPLLMILGEEDGLVPALVAQDSLAIKANIEIEVTKGAAHVPFLSHPDVTASYIKKFLEVQ